MGGRFQRDVQPGQDLPPALGGSYGEKPEHPETRGPCKLPTASDKCPSPEAAGIYLGCETRGSSFTSWGRTRGCTSAAAPSPRSAPEGFTSRLARLSAHFVHLKEAQGERTAC